MTPLRRHLFAVAVVLSCVLCALLATGLAEAKPHGKAWERAAYGAIAADVATTCYGLSHGAVEMNPLYGQECAQAIAINAGIAYLLHRAWKRHKTAWPVKFTFSVRASSTAWNLNQMRGR